MESSKIVLTGYVPENKKEKLKEVLNKYNVLYSNDADEIEEYRKQGYAIKNINEPTRSKRNSMYSIGDAYSHTIKRYVPKLKPQRVLRYYNPQTDKPRLCRNDICNCGSGKKFKNCCIKKY